MACAERYVGERYRKIQKDMWGKDTERYRKIRKDTERMHSVYLRSSQKEAAMLEHTIYTICLHNNYDHHRLSQINKYTHALERLLTMTCSDSTVPVLGCSVSPAELMSAISPVRRRRIEVFPKRGAPTRRNLRKYMSKDPRVARICR